MTIGVPREGQRGAIAPPKIAKNTFLTKNCAKFLYFSAQKPAREAYSAHSLVRSAPPPRRVPSPRQIPGYTPIYGDDPRIWWIGLDVVTSIDRLHSAQSCGRKEARTYENPIS